MSFWQGQGTGQGRDGHRQETGQQPAGVVGQMVVAMLW